MEQLHSAWPKILIVVQIQGIILFVHVILVVLFVLDVRVLVAVVVGEDLSNGGCRCGRGRPWKCLGRTPRLSTPMLAEALKDRLLLFRCEVAKNGTQETVVGALAHHAEAD